MVRRTAGMVTSGVSTPGAPQIGDVCGGGVVTSHQQQSAGQLLGEEKPFWAGLPAPCGPADCGPRADGSDQSRGRGTESEGSTYGIRSSGSASSWPRSRPGSGVGSLPARRSLFCTVLPRLAVSVRGQGHANAGVWPHAPAASGYVVAAELGDRRDTDGAQQRDVAGLASRWRISAAQGGAHALFLQTGGFWQPQSPGQLAQFSALSHLPLPHVVHSLLRQTLAPVHGQRFSPARSRSASRSPWSGAGKRHRNVHAAHEVVGWRAPQGPPWTRAAPAGANRGRFRPVSAAGPRSSLARWSMAVRDR